MNGVLFSFVCVIMSFNVRKAKFEPKVKPNQNVYSETSDISDFYLYKVLASKVRVILF